SNGNSVVDLFVSTLRSPCPCAHLDHPVVQDTDPACHGYPVSPQTVKNPRVVGSALVGGSVDSTPNNHGYSRRFATSRPQIELMNNSVIAAIHGDAIKQSTSILTTKRQRPIEIVIRAFNNSRHWSVALHICVVHGLRKVGQN